MDELTEKFRAYGAIFIILVIALLFLLVMLQFKEKSVTAMKLKIVYNEITQVMITSLRENGLPSEWGIQEGYKNANTLDEKFFKYFKVSEKCIHQPGKCSTNKNYKSIKLKDTNIKIYDIPSVTMKNGATIAIDTISSCKTPNEVCATIFIDTNGNGEPNALGKDLFVFLMKNSQSNTIIPYGEGLSSSKLKQDLENGCNKNSKLALYCAALIKQNDWSITADYPW